MGSTAAGEQVVVFPRRFVAPVSECGPAERAAAVAALDEALAAPLSVVCGPAGYGKTRLLAERFAALESHCVARIWFRAEPQDESFSGFLAQWLYQARRAIETPGAGPERTTTTLSVPPVSTGLAELHDLVAAADGPVLTVIDEFEAVDTPSFTEPFLHALRNLPPNLHVVLVCTAIPDALVGGVTGVSGVPVIGPDVLALDEASVARLLGDHPVDAADLVAATGGWPAIVHRVVGGLRDAKRTDGDPIDLEALLDSDAVHEYVSHHLLGGLDEETRLALTGLSTLEELPVAQAASAVGEAGAERLAEAATRLSPLFSLDDVPPARFICHPMLRRSLRRHRVRLASRRRQAIDSAVVKWYVDQHDVAAAIDYALQQQMLAELARLGEYFGPHTITLHGGVPRLRATYEVIDAETLRNSPRLLTGRATVLMKDGRFALAKAALDEAEALLERQGEPGAVFGSPRADLVNARYLMMLYNNDEFDESFLGDDPTEIRQLSIEDGIVGFVYALRAICLIRHSEFRRAESEAARSLYHYRKAGEGYGEASIVLVQGLAALAQGRLQKAETEYGEALSIIQRTCPDDPGLNATRSVLMSEVLYERNEIDAAEELLHSALDTLEESDGWLDPYAAAYRVGTGINLARGDAEGAHIMADRAARLAAQRGLVEIERLVQLHRAEIHLRAQEWDAAEAELRRYDDLRAAPGRHQGARDMAREEEPATALRLRLLLGQGDFVTVLERLPALIAQTEREGRFGFLARLKLIAALAHWKAERDHPALDTLHEAVELAAGKGYLRLFVDWGAELIPVLRRLIDCGLLANARAERTARAILRAIAGEQEAAGPAQQFSARELQVLSYLSRGQSNKQIARELDVTESTIKFHLKKIFARLGVSKRASAVVEARRMGLI
ncbi:LuxR C-terminal-related transcriptional regulator [Elongatibacter sediminis]|uniref:LuxR C-terminal-related transcriptional regulator n=1 Tax=Elongatibacter sediminis TaxID=3119006 RepID=A0AAW9RBJ7_9GAMM